MEYVRQNAAKAWGIIKREWPLELSATLLIGIAFILLTTSIRSLVGGYSAVEAATVASTDTFPSVIDNLLYWPYFVLVWVTRLVIDDAFFAARTTSALMGLSAVIGMFFIISRWFGPRLGIVGASVFLTGSWFLTLSRVGGPEISGVASLLVTYAAGLWLINSPRKLLPAIVALLSSFIASFTPFMPWLFIAGLIFAVTKARPLLKIVPIWLWIVSGLAALGVGGALIAGVLNNAEDVRIIFGLPSSLSSPVEMLRNIQESLGALFWFAPTNPGSWLSNLPVLDIFGVVMVVLGVYSLEQSISLRRSQIVIGTLLIITFFLGINDGVSSAGFSLLLPIITIYLISGLQQYLRLWLSVFPRNPFAKGLAVGALSILIAVSSLYQLQRYFVAWAQAPETREVYNIQSE